jgi:hypothetical protein
MTSFCTIFWLFWGAKKGGSFLGSTQKKSAGRQKNVGFFRVCDWSGAEFFWVQPKKVSPPPWRRQKSLRRMQKSFRPNGRSKENLPPPWRKKKDPGSTKSFVRGTKSLEFTFVNPGQSGKMGLQRMALERP